MLSLYAKRKLIQMSKIVNQKKYSEAFKRKVIDEFRQGKWATPYAIAHAYGMRPITASSWIDAAGLSHLRGRTVEIKTLGEVSELHRLRKENKKLREQLLDEVLARRNEESLLTAAAAEYGFSVVEFRTKHLDVPGSQG